MKRTYQPSKTRRARTHGFLVRMKTRGGRAVINARRAKGLDLGGGAQRAGGKWFTMSGMTLPGGVPLPVTKSGTSVFQLKQEVLLNLFFGYEFNKHWNARIDVVNALDKSYAIGAQGVGLADIVDPRTFSLQVSYSH